MRAHVFEGQQRVSAPLKDVFEFFSRAGNLERITPPWLSFSLTSDEPDEIRPGTLITYRLRVHHVPMKWVTRIDQFVVGEHFVDRQLTGPYKLWVHRHEFEADGDATIVRDRLQYQLPFGVLGAVAHVAFVRRDIKGIFDYRHQAIEQIFS